jgi:predicted phage baseplate assembly protein
MALTSPILDNRSYDQLRDELVKRIAVYTPEWTDYNESDPGIALLELFAYLGEAMLYQFNQIPDTTRLQFLQLLGVQPSAAAVAQVMLAASTDVAAGVQILKGSVAPAGSVSFETTDEVYAWPLDSVAAGKQATAGPTTKADQDRQDDALARLGLSPGTAATFYNTVTVPADPTAPGAASLDVSTTIDQALWIALLGKPTTDLSQLAGGTLFVGVGFDEAIPEGFNLEHIGTNGATAYAAANLDAAPPAMAWQIWNGPPSSGKTVQELATLDVLGDTTGGMVHTGVVKLQMPKVMPAIDPSQPLDGGASSPPPLTDQQLAARVVGWLRVGRPQEETDEIHRVTWVGLNAVGADQALTATAAELLGTGTGDSGQQYSLTKQRVLPGTVQLQVDGVDGWQDWTEVDSFATGGPDDLQFSVDYTSGVIQFGSGRVPQIGEQIRVLTYRYGGGAAGNVAAKSVTGITSSTGSVSVQAANPMPATGGAEPATLTDAMNDVPADVHRRDRAVIAEDFQDLAVEAGGVARAECLPLLHPDTPNVSAAGVVSVLVFPNNDNSNAPMPDHGLLRQVASYLDQRRLVTTELYVIPPTYKKISLSVGVQVRDGYQVDAVRRWVELILRQYLAPVPPYGPDGGGWPLGRAVRRAELEAVAVQVDGVDYLQGLKLAEKGAAGTTELVTLQRWEVPEVVDVTVVPGAPLPPGQPVEPTPPGTTPVPMPPDVCS